MRAARAAFAAMLSLAACLALCAPVLALQLENFDVTFTNGKGEAAMMAGEHPDSLTTSFEVAQREDPPSSGKVYPVELAKDLTFEQIPGLVGIPAATQRCSTAEFLKPGFAPSETGCPDNAAIGTVAAAVGEEGQVLPAFTGAVYNLQPTPGHAARFGFRIASVYVTVDLGVSESPPYRIVATLHNISQVLEFFSSRLTVWGNPGNSSHDPYRGHCLGAAVGPKGELKSQGNCPVESETPFLANPRACLGPLSTNWLTTTWQHPTAAPQSGFALTHDPLDNQRGFSGCGELPFSPSITAVPTTKAATSPSGLDFSLDVSDPGLSNPEGRAAADIEKTVVTLPKGMTINPSQAEGLEVCSETQVARETSTSGPGQGCPEASKIGTIEVETPLLPEALFKGSLFVAEPYHNPFGTLIALYVVIKDPKLGVKIVQPLRVIPDPVTGQLISTAEDMPQLPFSHFRLHFREGGRAPLISPPGCGSFNTAATLYPYSGAPIISMSIFQVISGPDSTSCPSGAAPFHPDFQAGTLNNAAGSYSPFDMRITRSDGEQDITKFSSILPPGVIGKIAGVSQCPEAGIARAKSRTGEHGGMTELADPSCPASSQIGTTIAGAGVGGQLTYVKGFLYLAGPYHGDPLSVVSVTPAVAGPFDAGTVVVRVALTLNPVTSEVEADGSASDPIPHILKGIPLNVRDLRVHVDRSQFTLNATSCEEEQTRAALFGGGTVLAPLADHPVGLSARYQAASCASLGFKPKLDLMLRGGTRRGKFPALHAVYTPREGDANLSRLALLFPRSEFIEQGHFRTICTRVQFAAGAGHGSACPRGATYGNVKVWTPLLSEPLEGPVILRSSNHNLPDAIFALHGPPSAAVNLEVAIRIDSAHGGLRATVEGAPDAPVSRAIVDMQGGQKGLFVNSANLCAAKHHARSSATGHNGRHSLTKPLVRAVKCKKAHRKLRTH